MSKSYDRMVEQLKADNYVDDKLLFTFTNIKRCPQGISGYSFVSVKDGSFNVYDADFKGPQGDVQFSVPLSEISDVKINTLPLIETLKFTHNGQPYQFASGFGKNHEISKFFKEKQ